MIAIGNRPSWTPGPEAERNSIGREDSFFTFLNETKECVGTRRVIGVVMEQMAQEEE